MSTERTMAEFVDDEEVDEREAERDEPGHFPADERLRGTGHHPDDVIEPSTDVVVREVAPPSMLPTVAESNDIARVAESLARSNLLRPALRNKANDIFTILVYGRDLGLRPSVALNKIHVIEGVPSLSAEAMLGLIRRAGHRVDSVCTLCGAIAGDDEARKTCPKPFEHGDVTLERGARVRGERSDTGEVIYVTFTIDDAEAAGLCELRNGKPYARSDRGKKKPWETFPKSLMWARSVSQLGRMLFSDVLFGLTYTGEELGAPVDAQGNVIDAEAWDIPPGERPGGLEGEELPDECDGEHDAEHDGLCCKRRIAERIDALPEDIRATLASTWKALLAQGKTHRLDELREGDRDAVGALLGQYEGVARKQAEKAAQEPQDAEVVEPGADDEAGRETATQPVSEDVTDVVDAPESAEDTDEVGHCAVEGCGAGIYREAGSTVWLHAEVPDDNHRAVPGGEAPPVPPPVETDDQRRARLELEVRALDNSAVIQALTDANLSLTGPPRVLRARLVDYRFVMGGG